VQEFIAKWLGCYNVDLNGSELELIKHDGRTGLFGMDVRLEGVDSCGVEQNNLGNHASVS
jgi:hypothetical protein